MQFGKLTFLPVEQNFELVASPVQKSIENGALHDVLVSEIDETLADTAAFCEHYAIGLDVSANCVILEAKRSDRTWYVACIILATTRADVNGAIRRHLDARKVSFAPMDMATSLTDMLYGGITPIGLPSDWNILIDSEVAKTDKVIIGSGLRKSKILISGTALASLPNISVLDIVKI